MSYKKYSEDYRLENVLGKNGKLVTKAFYRGDWYCFSASPEEVRRTKMLYGLVGTASILLTLAMLLLSKVMGKDWFVIMPLVSCTIAELFVGLGIYRLHTAKDKVTREHKEKIHNRLSPAALFQLVLAGLETCGCAAKLIVGGVTFSRIAYTVGTAVLALLGLLMFLQRKKLRMEKLPTQNNLSFTAKSCE